MPPEPTKAKFKRRTSRKDLEEYRFDGSHGRELELKRNRGEVSCAECRRLKIKCDKQIPCQSCQRRGCASLCPNGSLATGQGTRFVLAATEHLHRRISKMSGRIRQLEDALASVHAKHSSDPHPLLHEDLIAADERDGDADANSEEGGGQSPQTGETALDSFGTLSISEHGVSRFFGPTGGSESLLLSSLELRHASPECIHTPDSLRAKSPSSIGGLTLFSQSFPFSPTGQISDVQELVEGHLPSYERALSLCETYFEQLAWVHRGVTRSQVFDDMLPDIYKRQSAPPGEEYSGPHDLALLFIILAIGASASKEPSSALAEHYQQLSRAAISLQPVLEKPSIVTIQTLHLMSVYSGMSGSDLANETSMEMTWSLVALACHLAETIGLHRDSARWGLSPKMVHRRRILFWDLFAADAWQSLDTGRPPSFSLAYIDCGFPQYAAEDTKDGDFGTTFETWGFRFAAECVAEVAARTLTAEAPSYATIMELDRKVREFPFPKRLPSPPEDLGTSFQHCLLDHIRETLLLYIHRSFFAQALVEYPGNPLKSPYAPSFLAAYQASSTILKSVRDQFNSWPSCCSRLWTMWTFAFSASVVFGTVVSRGPRSPLAQSAMSELEQACILFSKASVYSVRATKALAVLIKLSEKSRYALAFVQSVPGGDKLRDIKKEDTEDELSIFAGRTRFMSTRRGLDMTSSPPRSATFDASPPHYSPASAHEAMEGQQRTYFQQGVRYGTHSDSYPTPTSIVGSSSASSSSSIAPGWGPSLSVDSRDQFMSATGMDVEDRGPQYPYGQSERHLTPSDASTSVYSWDSREPQKRMITPQNPSPPHHLQQPLTQRPSHGTSHSSHAVPQLHQSQQFHMRQTPIDLQPSHPPGQFTAQYSSHQPAQVQISTQRNQHPHSEIDPSQYPMYAPVPMYHNPSQPQSSDIELGDLGIAPRDSRMDDRWSSFMADSGLLEEFRRQ